MILRKSKKLLLIIFLFVVYFQAGAQNPKSQGYMGLWSRSEKSPEYGYRYSGGLGTFTSQHRPMAIYSAKMARTYFLYSGTRAPDESHLQIMISYFDHKSHMAPRPVIVYDKMGVTDAQDNASLSIDSDGNIWVFVSGRGRTRPGLIFKSTLPWSIDSFELVIEGEILFPQPLWLNDSCFFLLHSKRLNGRELFWTSSTDGRTWGESRKIAGFGGHFQTTGAFGNTIFTVFSYYPEGNVDNRTNLYLLKSDNFGKTWKNIDGKVILTPLTKVVNEALIKDYSGENKLVYINDLNFDSEGNPVILAIISSGYKPGESGEPRDLIVIRWKDNKWLFSKVAPVDHNFDMGPICISKDEWRIIAPTGAGAQKDVAGGKIELWVSKNEGADWEKSIELTKNSISNNSFPRVPMNYDKEFFAYWVDGDAENISKSMLYFTNEKCNKVWVLPYNMKKDFERPVRIR